VMAGLPANCYTLLYFYFTFTLPCISVSSSYRAFCMSTNSAYQTNNNYL